MTIAKYSYHWSTGFQINYIDYLKHLYINDKHDIIYSAIFMDYVRIIHTHILITILEYTSMEIQ